MLFDWSTRWKEHAIWVDDGADGYLVGGPAWEYEELDLPLMFSYWLMDKPRALGKESLRSMRLKSCVTYGAAGKDLTTARKTLTGVLSSRQCAHTGRSRYYEQCYSWPA